MVGKGMESMDAEYKHANLRVEGAVPHNRVMDLMSSAILLVNTSELEGFPNVFLEAWSCGTPVATLGVDPDGLIHDEGLGWVCDSVDELARLLVYLRSNPHEVERVGQKCRHFVRVTMTADGGVDVLEQAYSLASRNTSAGK
jgi:glycosyltransferase involved in cell wall biosynthesis